MAEFRLLDGRGVLAIGGEERRDWLQGLITNDTHAIGPDRGIYAALLSAHGKFLHDMILAEAPDGTWLVDCEAARAADLLKRLTLYRLRTKVTLKDTGADWAVAAVMGSDAAAKLGLGGEVGQARALAGGVALVDPRDARLGVRVYLPRAGAAAALVGLGLAEGGDYEALRLGLGIPDGSRDIAVDKAFLLECNFEALHGVAFDKGCYVGQENTARTKHRASLRKRLMRVDLDAAPPPPGTPILLAGEEVGEVRSGAGRCAIALLRLEPLEKAAAEALPLTAAGARVTPVPSP
ncbi:MAG: folate-binding protein YgfZ [Alphaproteobacteria bacterium]|nr:folate-binding protein YgfZ [Alphaproteobacteria bacterium]